ncbi:Origin recognition complex subunit 2, partial [Spiromyces aspiralis]
MGLTVGSNASMTATTRKRDTSKRSVMSLAQDFENVQLAKEAIDMIKLTTSTSSNQGIKGSGSATTAAVSGRRSLFLDDDALADDSENVQGNGPLVSGKALYGFRTPQGSRLRKPADTKSEGLSLTARLESSIRRAASAKAPSSARQIAPGQMAKDSSDKDQDEAYNSGSDNDDDGEYSDGYVRQRFKAANNSEYDKDDDDGDDELNQYLVRANEDIYADEASGTGGTSYERYFHDLHASSGGSQRCKTSNNTLSKLPRLEPGEYRRLLAEQPLKHESQRQQLVLLHQQQFFQWFFEL